MAEDKEKENKQSDEHEVTKLENDEKDHHIFLISIIGEIELSNLINGFSYSLTNYPLKNCPQLEILYLKNIYKNCTIDNDIKWSINLLDTKVKDECLRQIISELPDLYAKGLTSTDQIKLTLPPTNTLTAEQVQPAIDKGWTVVNCNF